MNASGMYLAKSVVMGSRLRGNDAEIGGESSIQ